ncbi:uncharacterized protein FOMMEDRAFT_165741 [Fomitiporia mediterranea MF3/22]|uniref:uncharacterized protein n=1 Tax=Fomitiporia mediterranea (strain MF3/22) TaxID=694068 RepID=UPI000440843A|nr:uncharacterized protein FOMMEDRAFT_165741 [Fomitiporia mediterranea MF3/22]EJD07146.1 hypothetical protein FOMMEDRAFT_165741 [Fomitiporia mediterranea MF3/22]
MRVELRHIHARLMSPAAELERSLGNQMADQQEWQELDQDEVQIQVRREDDDGNDTDSQEDSEGGSAKDLDRLNGESRQREEERWKWKQDKPSENEPDEEGSEEMVLLIPDVSKISLNDETLSMGSENGSTETRSRTPDVFSISPRENPQDETWCLPNSRPPVTQPAVANHQPSDVLGCTSGFENDSDEDGSSVIPQHTIPDDESKVHEVRMRVSSERIEESKRGKNSNAKVHPRRMTMTKNEAVQETRKLLNDIRDPDSCTPVTSWISKANNLSVILEQNLDMLSEALQLSEMCVSLSHQLSDEYPTAFRPLLASNLRNLAKRLWKNRQSGQALEHSGKAVSLYRQLVEEDPEAHNPELAAALMTYAIDLSEVRRHDEALEPMEEAVEIRRVLVEHNPAEYTFDLAELLKNYSILLVKLGRIQDALVVRREVVEIQEELAEQDPKKYNPYLASALKLLSSILSGIHEYQEALEVQVRHAQVRREISEKDLEKHAADIIRQLFTYSFKLADRKHREEALEAAEKAVELAAWLAKDDVHNTRHVQNDNDVDDNNDELEDDEDDGDGEDDEVSDGSDDSEPDPHTSLLAEAFTVLSDRLYEIKRDKPALKAILRAGVLWETLRRHDPDSGKYKFNFARSLDKLSQRWSVLNLHKKALKAANRAVQQWEDLVVSNDRHLPHLGERTKCSHYGSPKELVERNARLHEPGLAQSLVTQSIAFAKAGRRKEAPTPVEEAVDMYRRLAENNPKVYKRKLAYSLHEYAGRLSAVGQKGQALEIVTEAVDIYKQLAKDNPDTIPSHPAASSNPPVPWQNILSQTSVRARDYEVDFSREVTEVKKIVMLNLCLFVVATFLLMDSAEIPAMLTSSF